MTNAKDNLLDDFSVYIEQDNEVQIQSIIIIDDDDDDDNKDEKNNPANSIIEEQHLSQKLSQLSASEHEKIQSTTTLKKRSPLQQSPTTSTISKKIKIEQEKEIDKKIPDYLSADNIAFKQLLQSILWNTANPFNIADLQEIAFLIHQITLLNLQKLLWNAYLRSGTGRIEPNRQSKINLNISLWPLELKSMMIKNKQTKATDINQIDNDDCLTYVYRTLRQFVDRTINYQTQLDAKKHHLKNFFTSEMEDAIVKFIEEEQEIFFIRISIERKVAIIEFDCKDQLIESEFQYLKPTQNHLQSFRHFSRIKQEKETSKYEVALLKQRLIHDYLPDSLATLQLPLPLPPSSINTIKDEKNRQNLFDRYTKILQQTKSDMMSLYITIAEVKMQECQLNFDKDIIRMRPDHHSTTICLRLSESMIEILEQRLKNIDQRLECLYNLKICLLKKKKNIN